MQGSHRGSTEVQDELGTYGASYTVDFIIPEEFKELDMNDEGHMNIPDSDSEGESDVESTTSELNLESCGCQLC